MLLACLALVRGAGRLAKAGSRPSQQHPPGDHRFRPRRRRLLLPGRQADHLPGRGEGHAAIRSTRSSSWTWTPAIFAASARASAGPRAATFARRQEDHLRQQPSRPRRQEAPGRGIPPPRGGPPGRQAPPLPVGLRPPPGHLRGQPRRHRPEAPDRRPRLRRRGQLLARRQAHRLLLQPRTATWSCTSWTPTARTSAS